MSEREGWLAGPKPAWHGARMVIEMLAAKGSENKPLAEYLRPRADQKGDVPEQRVVFSGISWEDYLAFDEAISENLLGARLYYLDGQLEIVSTSPEPVVLELLENKKSNAPPPADYLRQSYDGADAEERVVFSEISWDDYLAVDRELGDDRSGPRLYYLEGELEIMTTSAQHERLKTWIGVFVADFVFERDIRAFPLGETTIRILHKAGAEPDESWCFHRETDFPHLALEVALSSGGLSKLGLYSRFGIPEVWFWRKEKIEVWVLRADRSGYDQAAQSGVLTGFDFALLERCLAMMPNWNEARRTFRDALRQA